MNPLQNPPCTRPSVPYPAGRSQLWALIAGLVFIHGALQAATVKDVRKKMGSRFEITAIAPSQDDAQLAIDAAYDEIDRIEALISSWQESSETSNVNAHAGNGPVPVSRELFNLVRRALKVSALTDGAFDITFAGAGRLWDFKSSDSQLPDAEEIRRAVAVVDYKLVELNDEAGTIHLTKPGMRIGFGAIGKGYAANRAAAVLEERGVSSGVINAGGDLVTFGRQEDGSPWTIAIADPLDGNSVFAWLEISDNAVVTSGDYESFIEIDGVRYSHILDPRTGFPVRGVRSATVLCPDAELADALATAISVLGPEDGLSLINQLSNIEGIIVDSEGQLHFSEHLESRFIEKGLPE